MMDSGAMVMGEEEKAGRKNNAPFHRRTWVMNYCSKFQMTSAILLVISVIAVSPAWGVSVPQRLESNSAHDEFLIADWNVIGPFQFRASDIRPDRPKPHSAGLDHDYLDDFGCPEAKCDFSGLSKIRSRNLSRTARAENGTVELDQLFPKTKYTVAYLVSRFMLDQPDELIFQCGSGDGVKVWLDHVLILSTSDDIVRADFKDTDMIAVHLSQGMHLIVAKVDHKTDDWAFTSGFMTIPKGQRQEFLQLDNNILRNRVLNSPVLKFAPGFAKIDLPVKIRVANTRGRVEFSRLYKHGVPSIIRIPSIPLGVYEVSATSDGAEIHDQLLLGRVSGLNRILKESSGCDIGYCNLSEDAAIRRYRILLKDPYYRPNENEWQKKLVMVARQILEEQECPLHTGCEPVPGFSLREYISRIDFQPQQYLVYKPHRSGKRLPLVLVVPYAERPERPFLESSLLAWPDDLNVLANEAEKNGFVVVIANGRGTVGDSPIGEEDLSETLSDVASVLPIDQRRIYLFGVCEGGRRALLYAEHHPDRFAGVGVYGPLITPYQGEGDSTSWFRANDVLSLSRNLSNTPIVVLWGDLDQQISPALINKFCKSVTQSGGSVNCQRIPAGMHKQKGLEEAVFPLFLHMLRKERPSDITLSASCLDYASSFWLTVRDISTSPPEPMRVSAHLENDKLVITSTGTNVIRVSPVILARLRPVRTVMWNGRILKASRAGILRDPDSEHSKATSAPLIASAFSQPFVLVLGTASMLDEASESAFLARWKADFFSKCPTVKDTRLSMRMASNENLIFFGEQKKGTISAKLSAQLWRNAHMSAFRRTTNLRNGPLFAFAQINPEVPGRIVVIAGGPPTKWKQKRANLALEGRSSAIQW
jgi:hypothetical protein